MKLRQQADTLHVGESLILSSENRSVYFSCEALSITAFAMAVPYFLQATSGVVESPPDSKITQDLKNHKTERSHHAARSAAKNECGGSFFSESGG
jgi:hypothetical protein